MVSTVLHDRYIKRSDFSGHDPQWVVSDHIARILALSVVECLFQPSPYLRYFLMNSAPTCHVTTSVARLGHFAK